MTAAELRAIVVTMTGGTWQVVDDAEDGEIVHAETGKYICRVTKHPIADNTRAIVALANHADALVELVAAVERWQLAECACGCREGLHALSCPEGSTLSDIVDAVEAVNTVGKEIP